MGSSTYAARLKAKAELCQYRMVAPVCKDDLCNCSGHKRQLYYRDEIVGTQLVAEAFNKELLSETTSLHWLEDKMDRLCALEKSESSSATLSGQIQSTAGVKVKKTEPSKCPPCHKVARNALNASRYILARLSATTVIRLGMSYTAAPHLRRR